MSSFKLKTRLKFEKEYYDAQWLAGFYGPGKYGVKFIEGPNAGHVFPAEACVGSLGVNQTNNRRKK